MKNILLLISTLVFLTACVDTSYQPSGFTGGFSQIKLADDVYRVQFSGNGFTSTEKSYRYALRRSAELSRQHGYRYFKVLKSSTEIDKTSSYRTPVEAKTSTSYNHSGYGYGNQDSKTTVSGGEKVKIHKPTTTMTIKLSHTNSDGALDAEAILSNFN